MTFSNQVQENVLQGRNGINHRVKSRIRDDMKFYQSEDQEWDKGAM